MGYVDLAGRQIPGFQGFERLRPPTDGRAYHRCDLTLFVSHDFRRVLVGGGPYGFEGMAREADAVEIEALAERLNVPELWRVMEALRAVPVVSGPADPVAVVERRGSPFDRLRRAVNWWKDK